MEKDLVASVFDENGAGEPWYHLVQLERRLLADLHHPLLVNLKYAFQNVRFLCLVMDVCLGGDLSKYALTASTFLAVDTETFLPLPGDCTAHAFVLAYRPAVPPALIAARPSLSSLLAVVDSQGAVLVISRDLP